MDDLGGVMFLKAVIDLNAAAARFAAWGAFPDRKRRHLSKP